MYTQAGAAHRAAIAITTPLIAGSFRESKRSRRGADRANSRTVDAVTGGDDDDRSLVI
jgi:hypothetical protein